MHTERQAHHCTVCWDSFTVNKWEVGEVGVMNIAKITSKS